MKLMSRDRTNCIDFHRVLNDLPVAFFLVIKLKWTSDYYCSKKLPDAKLVQCSVLSTFCVGY